MAWSFKLQDLPILAGMPPLALGRFNRNLAAGAASTGKQVDAPTVGGDVSRCHKQTKQVL
jgi:hypothetical protein